MLKSVFVAVAIISGCVVFLGLESAAKFKECRANGSSVSYCHLITSGR